MVFCSPLRLRVIFPRVGHLNSCFSSFANLNPTRVSNRIPVYITGSSKLRVIVSDTYECNTKISNLGRHGKVKDARKLFDEMPQRDIVSYASMITVYLKNNNLPQAEMLFRAMPERNMVADSAMISGYVKAGQIDKAREVFDHMVERNTYSWTSLVSGYFNIGKIDEAIRLFNLMPEKNVVSWTIVVAGYAQNGCIDEARDIFYEMPEKNIVAWTVMVKSYIQNDRIDEAFEVFYQMPQRNLYSWNIMISGCINANRLNAAIQLFNSMPKRNAISWTTIVTGLARNGMTEHAREYFDQMPKKDIAAWNAMITAYVDQGSMDEASEIFNLMPEKNIVSWNAMIDGYARNGLESDAVKHLILMLRYNFKPNETTITSVLTACDSTMELMQAHGLVIHLGFEHDTLLSNALITMYSRCGDVLSAWFVFDQLEAKDIVSWTAMILAYSKHGCGSHALQIFARMLRSGSRPDEVTFVGVLSACSHAGLVMKGQKLFDSMSCAYSIEPKAEHYSCLVDILGRAGQVNKAMKVVSEMPPHERDGAVLGALLGACRLHKDVGLANEIGNLLIEQEPNSSGSYSLLANVYAECGKWNEFAQVRKKMKERNVKKEPGFSQIEVKGKSHIFLVGDRSQTEVEEIYDLLDHRLLPVMCDMCYTPEIMVSV
ncbi:pentatricopeptide repeat-containing protein At4g02750 isoform X1 [Jatropha curcas]|uniref:pentatricopeptide repeat-containing protein At4g02750 isoform X1 n=1 Tax=Jatropha curcas TaxID=180498 RepID=UPI0005FC19E2|nr:pentatricopeptide repeat-containing protein At4g02750 isoform X1 [Jatropha curcas]